MPLSTWSSSFLTSELPLLILFTLYQIPGRIIPVSDVCELLIKVHDILYNTVSKQVGNSACILVHVFNFAYRQCHDILASQFHFLHGLQDVVPPSEACLYGHINWSLDRLSKSPP